MKRKILIDSIDGEQWKVGEKVAYDSQNDGLLWGKVVGLRNEKQDILIRFDKIEYLNERDQVGIGKKRFVTVPAFTVVKK